MGSSPTPGALLVVSFTNLKYSNELLILSRLISTKESYNNKPESELELIALDNNLENKIDKITNSLSRQYFNTILKNQQ